MLAGCVDGTRRHSSSVDVRAELCRQFGCRASIHEAVVNRPASCPCPCGPSDPAAIAIPAHTTVTHHRAVFPELPELPQLHHAGRQPSALLIEALNSRDPLQCSSSACRLQPDPGAGGNQQRRARRIVGPAGGEHGRLCESAPLHENGVHRGRAVRLRSPEAGGGVHHMRLGGSHAPWQWAAGAQTRAPHGRRCCATGPSPHPAPHAPPQAGTLPKWGVASEGGTMTRRNVFMGELKQMGIKQPDQIATPSVRNDAAFLFSTVGEAGHPWAVSPARTGARVCDATRGAAAWMQGGRRPALSQHWAPTAAPPPPPPHPKTPSAPHSETQPSRASWQSCWASYPATGASSEHTCQVRVVGGWGEGGCGGARREIGQAWPHGSGLLWRCPCASSAHAHTRTHARITPCRAPPATARPFLPAHPA